MTRAEPQPLQGTGETPVLHPVAKLIVGAGISLLIILLFPVLELLEGFLNLFLLPLVLLLALGLMSEGTYETIRMATTGKFMDDLRSRVDHFRNNFRKTDLRSSFSEADQVVPVEPTGL